MRRRRSRALLAQLTMLAITLVGLYYVGFKVLGRDAWGDTVHLTVRSEVSGGVFPKSEVSYRGVRICTVTAVDTRPDHVEISLEIENDADVPRDSQAMLTYLSPIGE